MRTFKKCMSVERTHGPWKWQDRSVSGRLKPGLKLNKIGAKRIDPVRFLDILLTLF